MAMTTEMPGVPHILCVCMSAADFCDYGCVCDPAERYLRHLASGRNGDRIMTEEQKAWCVAEIRACGDATNQPDHFDDYDDRAMAMSVLSAWSDYARDKGLI